jgi:outer membrane lipoprotein SlyB
MKRLFILAIIASLAASLPEPATAQSSSKHRYKAKSTMVVEVGGVETIKPQEAPSKDTGGAAGWNGAYVGVNAGRSFGATAGTNVVVPFVSSGKLVK